MDTEISAGDFHHWNIVITGSIYWALTKYFTFLLSCWFLKRRTWFSLCFKLLYLGQGKANTSTPVTTVNLQMLKRLLVNHNVIKIISEKFHSEIILSPWITKRQNKGKDICKHVHKEKNSFCSEDGVLLCCLG